jgi:hypothetical protein
MKNSKNKIWSKLCRSQVGKVTNFGCVSLACNQTYLTYNRNLQLCQLPIRREGRRDENVGPDKSIIFTHYPHFLLHHMKTVIM